MINIHTVKNMFFNIKASVDKKPLIYMAAELFYPYYYDDMYDDVICHPMKIVDHIEDAANWEYIFGFCRISPALIMDLKEEVLKDDNLSARDTTIRFVNSPNGISPTYRYKVNTVLSYKGIHFYSVKQDSLCDFLTKQLMSHMNTCHTLEKF